MQCKYVVGKIGGLRAAITFPEYVRHADAARCFQPDTITGAGFFYVTADEVIAYGESDSLNIKSNPVEDHRFIGLAIGHSSYIR